MGLIHFFVVGFGRPDLLPHQQRLLDKHLTDEHTLCLVDNTPDPGQMESVCRELGVEYERSRSEKFLHNDALNQAALLAHDRKYEFWMTLDHDVFPRRRTALVSKIKKAGFYGIGQYHHPTQRRYLWPGFAGFSRKWLNGRIPDFNGYRGENKRDDGDCGSMLANLFTDHDWDKMHRGLHGYGSIRPEDGVGLQSWGYEVFDNAWVHLTNASHWLAVPDPEGRDEKFREMLAKL